MSVEVDELEEELADKPGTTIGTTLKMWLILLTPSLSRRKANSVCGVLTKLYAFMHGPDNVCLGHELVCDTAAGSHGNSECDIFMDCCDNRG